MMQINQVLDSWFNKGFRGPKCKTLLKLATSRIKLLRNKRVIQLKQLRRELALLLENGQESTARIRVEHIIREQNTMEAYDTLELFCELLIVRMPIIESQRECPLDLQEAVASLIFAAPRASDLPELLEVQNMLSFKYGKEFVAAATELRPDCNVNRLVIEKLSTRAPTMEVKLDLMKEIAEEHDIEWDSASTELEFSKPPEDLLDGPKHFVGPIQMSPIPHDRDDLHADQLMNSDSSFQKQGPSLPSAPKGKLGKSSTHLQSVDPIEEAKFVPFLIPPSKYGTETMAGRFYSPPRESSITQQSDLLEETLIQRSLSRTKSEGSMNLQDIIEAAEAAAESAEQAARAARAAAELARSRISPRFKHEEVMPQIASETDQDIPSVVELNSKANTGNGKTSIQRIPDSYDWTQGEKHQEKEVSHVDPMVEDQGYPKGDGSSAFDQYGENNYSYDDMSLLNHQPLVKGEIPFLEDGKLFTSATSDWLGHDEESEGGHQPVYDAPSFDGAGTSSYPEPFQRLPSLEDDPYYTYPNLFSKPSSGSTTSS